MEMIKVLSIVDKIRNDWYDPPRNCRKKRIEFEYQSYKKSALDEIKMYLMENENENPISLMEIFRSRMDDFACRSKSGTANFMFSVYYDVATDVIDVLIGEER